MKERMNQE